MVAMLPSPSSNTSQESACQIRIVRMAVTAQVETNVSILILSIATRTPAAWAMLVSIHM